MSLIGVHQFSSQILDKQVCYQVLKMKDSLVIWIGMGSDPIFRELSVAMKTDYENSPTSLKLMGDPCSLTSLTMAVHLSKKCKKQVFISLNVPDTNQEIIRKIEERLMEEIAITPESF